MANFTEGRHTGEHILSEANGSRSRVKSYLTAGDLPAGSILTADVSGHYSEVVPGATDGTEVAAGVLYGAVDASEDPQPCVVHVRDCEVMYSALNLPQGTTGSQLTAIMDALADKGILIR